MSFIDKLSNVNQRMEIDQKENLAEKIKEGSKTSALIQKISNINDVYFDEHYVPIEVFCKHIFTRLSNRDLQSLLFTNKFFLLLLTQADVLNRLFSNPCIKKHLKVANAAKPYMHLVTHINLNDLKRWKQGLCIYSDEDCVPLIQMSPNLTSMNLRNYGMITDKTIYALASYCTKLKVINLKAHTENSKTCNAIGTLAKNCTSLTNFHCDIKLSDLAVEVLEKICSNLNLLDLRVEGELELKKRAIQVITQKCTKLSSLKLEGFGVTDEEMIAIASKNTALTDLQVLFEEKITGKAIIEITKICPDIAMLSLIRRTAIKPQEMITALNQCCNLTALKLRGVLLTEKVMAVIAKNGSKLKKLCLSGENQFLIAMRELANRCCSLTSLSLSLFGIGDGVIPKIAANNSNLTYLRLTHCLDDRMTKEISEVAQKCVQLTELYLDWNKSIEDKDIQAIAQHCHKLVVLDLSNTSITEVGLDALSKGCRNLKALTIKDCANITSASVDKLEIEYPHLCIESNCDSAESMSEDDDSNSDADSMVDND